MEKETYKEVKFSTQMTAGTMFDFMYWHSYHGLTGVVNYGFSLVGLIALLAGFGGNSPLVKLGLVALALLFTVINPLILYYKSVRQVKSTPMFQKPLHYKFDTRGFAISQENQSDSAEWKTIILVRETRKNLILYMGAANAMILPKKDMGNQVAELKKLIRAALPELAKKLK